MSNSKFSSNSPDANNVYQGTSGGFYDTAGAITEKGGSVVIGGSGATALTLAAPTSGSDDGKKLKIVCATAHAHTVTTPSNGLNGNHHIATFAAAGDFLELVAYQGVWYGGGSGATLS